VTSANTPDLSPGDSMEINAPAPLNLADVYLDVEVGGEGVDYWALE